MRKYIPLILVVLFSGCSNNSVTISGKLENAPEGEYLYLAEIKETAVENVDSVKLEKNGNFSFKREIDIPAFYLLKQSNGNFFTLLAGPGEKIEVKAVYNRLNEPVSVKGSEGTDKLLEYNKVLKSTTEKLRNLSEIYRENASSPDLPKVVETIDSTARVYLSEINSYTKKFIDDNTGSLVTLIALYQQVAPRAYVLDPVKDINYFIKVDSVLYRRYPASGPVRALHEQVAALVEGVTSSGGTLLTPGNEAPDFTLPSPDGQMISLSSTRGKVVLLDFWAAWCGPCRLENPNLVRAYEKYHNKGFEIFQVSLDRTREAWLKGIEEDKLGKWIHVSDLKYWESSVVSLYHIEQIPNNYLLDRDGKIIAVNLRGEDLQSKLAEIFQ
ncbi:MAG TPA: TlpA disulfide reductase family protein [Bacteroidales bacterium]|nr:TlpA disulfide reductase family protein [Bacteroidales bacterium]HOK74285.1 TlpA disulfide reductase family protein [Bacteroidales bacterium]HPP92873.1 TlpA disulfide reductase family protein [Bacteroidales bacterium]HQG55690.1 TlpA disulfide reductase family protein [Bacteroidales bacterium]HQK71082.1 TlpA disulfide reductase family protein [Bacteroidales bacterium]